MAEHFSFFDPVLNEDGTYDREYNAQEFTDYFGALVTTGIMKGVGNQLSISADGASMQIKLNTGIAFVEAHYYENDSVLTHTHDTEVVGKDRIDRIVIRLDLSTEARHVKSFIKKGVASTSPVAPSLTQTPSLYEISVAQVKVIGGQTFISASNVIDERGKDVICPWAGSKILPNFNNDTMASHVNNALLHKQTYNAIQTGTTANAEGSGTEARGDSSHVEGAYSVAGGTCAHAEGESTIAMGLYSHAEGSSTTANGVASHAEGLATYAGGNYSHAGGYQSNSAGGYSFAHGYDCRAMADRAFAAGSRAIAGAFGAAALGRYNKLMNGYGDLPNTTDDLFVIGNGTSDTSLSNSLRVNAAGQTFGKSSFNSTGADYAEYFEWFDGNTDGEERQGYFVTLENDTIRKATSADEYILGIVSINPSVIGDSYQDEWAFRYVTDEWGRIQYRTIEIPEKRDENGELIYPVRYIQEPIENPDWDPSVEYIPREKRQEWSPVGIVGKLLVRDDGTCEVNGFCKSNDDGIATKSETGYRVMKRVSENIVQVFIK
ncbi:peptidase G2 autoproteolytic cleavage domain-containing protein [Rummeliibacillus sp. POC4]|uniref:peptidase G2 autoproteolytic cleavage domain-containing protein n=1 Tax=Rummeliibacillus sp. POC4 TaxID=2305899 RepID=UPI000E671BCB|nr:peptidase G2 autoproteolytic cleavage domain-containing protein [Rummeliibacillus sp. POC4]RIJ64094.1 hypothetical protein D1606_11960 [Rummeliibacillus sp. POC4]